MYCVPSNAKHDILPWFVDVAVDVTDVVAEEDSVDVAVEVTVDVLG
jgi:hypothetical protein